MKIGLAFDLKDDFEHKEGMAVDALEEYDSAETVTIIRDTLKAKGHDVMMLGGGREFIKKVMEAPPDIVFNIAEGRGVYRSRESQVPSILEMLDIPYTGSDPQTLAVCLDKPLTKKLAGLEGVPTPRWMLFENEDAAKNYSWQDFTFPAIIKPAFEGSSKGIHSTALVFNAEEAHKEIVSQLKDYHQAVMVEEFIDGDEITVGIIGNKQLSITGIMRVLPRKKQKHFVYSLEVKRDWKQLVDYECPAALSTKTMTLLEAYSRRLFKSLGCRDFSRVDFRIRQDGTPYFIEINPLPGLGTYSDLIIMAEKQGVAHQHVIGSVFDAAMERYPGLPCA